MKPVALIVLCLSISLLAIGQQTGRSIGMVRGNGNESLAGDSIAASESKSSIESIVLGEVTVTAQKRLELPKEVPIALSRISANFLESNVLETMGSMAAFVPGVQVQEQSVVFPGFVIRGLTSDNYAMNVDNRVSVFQDGVSISKQIGAATEFFDMDRVEVLKGPQGTLFGRSAQIGAIHLITMHAKNETSGSFALGTGNYHQFRANGYVNLPLVNDKLFVRLAGIYNKRDGYVENLSGGTLMGKNTLATRASLKYQPDQNHTLDIILNYERDRAPGTDFKSGLFAPRGGDTNPFTFVDLEAGKELIDSRDVYGVTAQYKQQFSEDLSFTAITGYRTITSAALFDSDGTKARALALDCSLDYHQFSQEVRLNFEGERFSGFAGLNYFREYGNQSFVLTQDERSVFAMLSPILAAKIPGFRPIPMIIDGEPNLSVTINPFTGRPLKTFHTEKVNDDGAWNSTVDAFADGTFKVTPKFKITVGGRLIFEDQTSFYRVDPAAEPGTLGFLLGKGPNNLFKPTDGRLEQSKTFRDWVGRFILQYDFSKQVSTYASWSKGHRPHVIQINANATEFLDAEIVYNYEVGIKNLLLNKRLQCDISGFLYDYRNFQTTSSDLENGTFTHISDSGKATGLGVETDVQFVATRNLTLFVNYAWLDAQFNDKDSDGNPQKLAGNSFRLTPKNSGSAGLSYRFVLGNAGFLALNLSATSKTGYVFDDENTPGLFQGAYTLCNAALQYTSCDGRYGLRLNINNLSNKRYLIDAGNTGLTFGIPTFVPGPPRFYGVQLFVTL